MKKVLSVLLVLSLVFGLAACSGSTGTTTNANQATTEAAASNNSAPAAGKTYELKLGHTGAPDHHYQAICEQFAEEVSQLTNGNVKISIFPSDQLGKQMESVEGTMLGTHDMVLTSDMVLSNWVPEMGILNLPFIFKDNAHLRAVLNGPVGEQLAEKMVPHNAVVIGWWDNGFRHVTNNIRPIASPDDLKGMKIRVPEGKVYLETFKSLGAVPTAMAFSELYSALQLKTVDGQENPPAHILTQKFFEVQKYVSRTGHIHSCSPLIINKDLLEGMPQEYQDAIVNTAMSLGDVHTKMVEDLEIEQWKQVADNGMEILDVDKAPFIEAVQPVYDMYRAELGNDIIDAILNT